MELVRAGPDRCVFKGQLAGQTCRDFEGASEAAEGIGRRHLPGNVPTRGLSRVTYIPSTAIGLLVALRTDRLDQGRWLDLLASDRALYERSRSTALRATDSMETEEGGAQRPKAPPILTDALGKVGAVRILKEPFPERHR